MCPAILFVEQCRIAPVAMTAIFKNTYGNLILLNIHDRSLRVPPMESEVGTRVQYGQHSSPRARQPVARDLQSQIRQNSEIGDYTYEL